MEPWQLYFDELKRRTGGLPDRAFGRAEIIAEAAHDAYQVTTDRLTSDGWNEEAALMVTRIFGQAVKEWLGKGSQDWTALQTELGRRYHEWSASTPQDEQI